MARCLGQVLEGLVVDPARMRRNLDLTKGRIYSQRLMLALMNSGWTRKHSYEKVQRLSAEAEARGLDLAAVAGEDPEIASALGDGGIAEVFDPRFYGRYTDQILRETGILEGARRGRKNTRKSVRD
jgi:adenylosuccinate lyase